MSLTSPYDSRYQALKPIPLILTLSLVLVSMILGSIIAVVLSWAWLLFSAMMLAVQAVRMRIKSFMSRNSRNSPITVEGVYSVVSNSRWNEKQ